MYQFLDHCDLDLVSRIIVSGAYLIYYLRKETQIWRMDASFDADMSHTILGHCDLDPILCGFILGHFDLDIDFWPHF